mgnify:CR=1 FL=1
MYPFVHIGSVALPTYTVIISLIFSLSVFWLLHRAQKLNRDRGVALDLGLVIMICGFLGSRVFHVIYEEPKYYWEEPADIFKVWQGGFVFYGGFLGAWLGGIWFLKKKRQPILVWHDLLAPIISLGYSLGRLACLAAGCCYGKETYLPWGIRFPLGVEAPTGISLHPTQLYSSIWEFLVFLVLITLESRPLKNNRIPGVLFAIWLTLHALGRLVMEYFRMDARGPSFLGLSISSLISLILLVCAVALYIRLNKIAKR